MVHSKPDIRDLRGLTNFIPYKRDPVPILIFLYDIFVANNQITVISNLIEININEVTLVSRS